MDTLGDLELEWPFRAVSGWNKGSGLYPPASVSHWMQATPEGNDLGPGSPRTRHHSGSQALSPSPKWIWAVNHSIQYDELLKQSELQSSATIWGKQYVEIANTTQIIWGYLRYVRPQIQSFLSLQLIEMSED